MGLVFRSDSSDRPLRRLFQGPRFRSWFRVSEDAQEENRQVRIVSLSLSLWTAIVYMYVWIYVVTSGKKPIVIDESDLEEVDDDDDDDESSESISDEEEVMQMVGHWVVPYD